MVGIMPIEQKILFKEFVSCCSGEHMGAKRKW